MNPIPYLIKGNQLRKPGNESVKPSNKLEGNISIEAGLRSRSDNQKMDIDP